MLRPITALTLLGALPVWGAADAGVVGPDGRFDLGHDWVQAFAPEGAPARQAFPDDAQWQAFLARVQRVLDRGSLADLAALEAPARAMVNAFQAMPVFAAEAAWLNERLDYMEVARIAPTSPPEAGASPVPFYQLWLHRLGQRPAPSAAEPWATNLPTVFTAEELPGSLVWLAEVESSFDPAAKSPVGAAGLFQLMPDTANDLGLDLEPEDGRLDPHANAQAAARYLHDLHRRFADWPLAFAAYNAGPTRVAKLLRQNRASTYAAIAPDLPAETRMFVPKVLATLTVRAAWTVEGPTP